MSPRNSDNRGSVRLAAKPCRMKLKLEMSRSLPTRDLEVKREATSEDELQEEFCGHVTEDPLKERLLSEAGNRESLILSAGVTVGLRCSGSVRILHHADERDSKR